MIAKGSLSPQYFELETVCMPGWNPVRRSLETGEADAAFILAPIAMDLFSVKTPIRLILFAHRNGSICVRGRTKARGKTLRESLKSGVLLLPHILSVHHMLANMFLREIGLKLGPVGQKGADVFYEVVPPVKMPECLATQPDACGFVVAEPLGSKSIAEGHADLMFLSGELWENHPCCVVAMRQAFIEAHPDAAYEFVEMLVTAGRFIYEEPDQSALLAVDFLDPNKVMNLSSSLLASVLKEPRGLKTDDMLPVVDDLDRIQRYMSDIMGIGTLVDLEKFVDDRFAQAACARLPQTKRPSVIHDPSLIVAGMINRQMRGEPDQGVFQAVEEGDSLNFIISSEARMVDRLVDETRTFLKKVGIQNFSEINLVMRELLLNAIEHGNQNDPGRKVTCQVSKFLEDVIKITVSDEGQGFNYQKLNMTPPADATQTRHRGYAIVRAFSKKIEFNARGNQVSVYIKTQQETHFKVREEDGWQIIHPNGDITAAVADRFRRLLHGLVEKGHRRFRFDLEKVRDMDSISLSVFIVLHKVLGTREHDLEMINVCGDLFNLFNMMHLNQTYRIVGEVRKEL
jgi:anti-anti-sigma factor